MRGGPDPRLPQYFERVDRYAQLAMVASKEAVSIYRHLVGAGGGGREWRLVGR